MIAIIVGIEYDYCKHVAVPSSALATLGVSSSGEGGLGSETTRRPSQRLRGCRHLSIGA